jgi:maleate isomerase
MFHDLSGYPQVGAGIIVPYDFALDRELWRWTPAGSSLHLTRLPAGPAAVTIEMVTSVGNTADVRAAVGELLTVEPAVVAYACTSGSFIAGPTGEHALVAAMLNAGAPAAVTTSGALLQALDLLGIQRVSIATPYSTDITAGLRDFLIASGRQVVGSSELGLAVEIWKVRQQQTAELIRSADAPTAEAIVVSCTNLPSYDVIAPLEAELGKPIISANQATMWAAMRLAGLAAVGDGQRLLAH